MSDIQTELMRKDLEDLRHRMALIRAGLEAALHIIEGNPQLIVPVKSLVETMIKIVDD